MNIDRLKLVRIKDIKTSVFKYEQNYNKECFVNLLLGKSAYITFRDSFIVTSFVVDVHQDKQSLIFKTSNSVYEFEKI